MPIDIFPRRNPALAEPFMRERELMRDRGMMPEARPFVEHLLTTEERDAEPHWALRPDAAKRLETPGVREGLGRLMFDPGLPPELWRLFDSLLKRTNQYLDESPAPPQEPEEKT